MEMHDVPAPTVQTPLDVIVRVGAAGVCRIEIHICDGEWKEKSNVELPYTIGHENAGWVHEVGTSVSNVKVGDKAILHPLMTCRLCTARQFGDDVHCGENLELVSTSNSQRRAEDSEFPRIDADGGYAEYIRTTARSVIKLDDKLEPSDVAAPADGGLTAYHMVAKAARIPWPGDYCVMIGAGGVSALARASGVG